MEGLAHRESVHLLQDVLPDSGRVLLQKRLEFQESFLAVDEQGGGLGPDDGVQNVFGAMDAADRGDTRVPRVYSLFTSLFERVISGSELTSSMSIKI